MRFTVYYNCARFTILSFYKFYSHNCYIYITIQTIQIHVAATISMFYSIGMYAGKTFL